MDENTQRWTRLTLSINFDGRKMGRRDLKREMLSNEWIYLYAIVTKVEMHF